MPGFNHHHATEGRYFFALACIKARMCLKRATHSFMLLPSTSAAISFQRSFAASVAGCLRSATSSCDCCGFVHSRPPEPEPEPEPAAAGAPAPAAFLVPSAFAFPVVSLRPRRKRAVCRR